MTQEREIERDIVYLREGDKNLMKPELEFMTDLGSWCGRAIHLQCAGGVDTLSLWNQRAGGDQDRYQREDDCM